MQICRNYQKLNYIHDDIETENFYSPAANGNARYMQKTRNKLYETDISAQNV